MKVEITEEEKKETLKNFMLEFFDFDCLKKAGFYDKSIKRNDYEAQADRVCKYFGLKTVYEYGAREVHGHISVANPTEDDKFITVTENIYTE